MNNMPLVNDETSGWAFQRLCDSSLFRVAADQGEDRRGKPVSTPTYLIRIAICSLLAPVAIPSLFVGAPVLLFSYFLKFDFIPQGNNGPTITILGMLASKYFRAAVMGRYWLDFVCLTQREKPTESSSNWEEIKVKLHHPVQMLQQIPQFFRGFLGSILNAKVVGAMAEAKFPGMGPEAEVAPADPMGLPATETDDALFDTNSSAEVPA